MTYIWFMFISLGGKLTGVASASFEVRSVKLLNCLVRDVPVITHAAVVSD